MFEKKKPISYHLGISLRRLLGIRSRKPVRILTPADFAKYYHRPDWLLILLGMFVWAIPGSLAFLIPSSESAIYFTIWLIMGLLTFITVLKRQMRVSMTKDYIMLESDGAKTSIKYSDLFKIGLRAPRHQEDPVCFLTLETKDKVFLKMHESSIEDFDSLLIAFKERKLQVDDLPD